MNYIRCGMAQAKLTRIALRLRRESAINNNNIDITLSVSNRDTIYLIVLTDHKQEAENHYCE